MNMNEHRELISFMRGERLKEDGSNFVDWYLRLRTVLKRANVLFVIQEHLGNPPDDNMNEQIMLDYHNRRRTYSIAKGVIEICIPQDLREQFEDADTYDMIDMLKSMFMHQFMVAKFELENKFLSTKMEENTCLKTHVAKMYGIHLSLVEDFDLWTIEESAIYTVLRSLPPIYTDLVHGYVEEEKAFNSLSSWTTSKMWWLNPLKEKLLMEKVYI